MSDIHVNTIQADSLASNSSTQALVIGGHISPFGPGVTATEMHVAPNPSGASAPWVWIVASDESPNAQFRLIGVKGTLSAPATPTPGNRVTELRFDTMNSTGAIQTIATIDTVYMGGSAGQLYFRTGRYNGTVGEVLGLAPSAQNYAAWFKLYNAEAGGNLVIEAECPGGGNNGITLRHAGTAVLGLENQTVGSAVSSTGGAESLPSTPAGYLTVNINGTNRKLAFY